MNGKTPFEALRTNVLPILAEVSIYFEGLILREESPQHLAARLNEEVPAKMSTIHLNLVAALEEQLQEIGEQTADGLTAQLRIRYFEEKKESLLVSGYRVSEWKTWRPQLTENVQIAGAVLTAGFSLAALLATLKSAGLLSIKIPVIAGSPYSTVVIFAALALLSGVTVIHPEQVPLVLETERTKAREELALYLRKVEADFLTFAHGAERSLERYLEQLKAEHSTRK